MLMTLVGLLLYFARTVVMLLLVILLYPAFQANDTDLILRRQPVKF